MTTEIATSLEMNMVELINAERREAGLQELLVETHLNSSAQSHSEWMAENGVMSHDGEGGSTPTERIRDTDMELSGGWKTAENVAYSSIVGAIDQSEIEAMHEALMNSDSHRANIMNPDLRYIGIGTEAGTIIQDGQEYQVLFITQNFADTEGRVEVQTEEGGQMIVQDYVDGEPLETDEPEPAVPDDSGLPPDQVEPSPEDGGYIRDDDDEEEDPQDEDTGSGGGCFVATAAYGTRNHPDVIMLREFRDNVLVKRWAGRRFVKTYWIVGPVMAKVIRSDGVSGKISRTLLRPFISILRRR